MKKFQIYFPLLIALVVVLSACKKDEPEPEPDPTDPPITTSTPNEQAVGTLDLGQNITADFNGQIMDEYGVPLSGVSIMVGNKTATTDANGIFTVENATVKEDLAFVKCTKSGYFHASRSVLPSETSSNYVRIQMMTLDIVSTFASDQSASVSVGGATVDFDGDYIDANGTLYNGTVSVAMKHLPAMDANTGERMPGMLYAQNAAGDDGVLATYGMVAVELFGSSGQELQLANGSAATIHMDVDASQLSGAPATIPLWHFDEVAGYWVEEGSAALTSGKYVGTVDHFSFWNCDDFYEDCRFYGTITAGGSQIAQSVSVTINAGNSTTTGTTNNDGTFQTYLPANEAVAMDIGDYCGGPSLATYNFGPYAIDSENNETMSASFNAPNYFQVIGVLKDCNGDPVTNGYVYVETGGVFYGADVTNGDFDFTVVTCDQQSQVDVYCYAMQGGLIGDSFTVPVTQPTTVAGVVELCNQTFVPGEFIAYTIDNGPLEILLTDVDYNDFGSYFTITDSSGTCMIQSHNINGLASTVLTYGTQQNTIYVFPTWFIDLSEYMQVYCLVDRFDGPGGYIRLTAWGTYSESPGVTHDFELEAQALM